MQKTFPVTIQHKSLGLPGEVTATGSDILWVLYMRGNSYFSIILKTLILERLLLNRIVLKCKFVLPICRKLSWRNLWQTQSAQATLDM